MNDRHMPLDHEEAELARALRDLPNGEPGARIDSEILAVARASVQRRSPVRRPWIWSLGTAAAAVLAFGTLLRMQHSGLEPLDEASMTLPGEIAEEASTTAGRSESASSPAGAEAKSDDNRTAPLDRIEVSGTRIAPEPAPKAEPVSEMAVPVPPASPPPPPAPPALVAPPPQAFPLPKSSAAPHPRPPPPQTAPPVTKEAPPAPAESPAPSLQSAPAMRASDAPAPARRERGVSQELRSNKSAVSAATFDAEGEIKRAASEAPERLFARVRALIDAGENQHARDLLQAWHRAHPDYLLPDDMRILLESS